MRAIAPKSRELLSLVLAAVGLLVLGTPIAMAAPRPPDPVVSGRLIQPDPLRCETGGGHFIHVRYRLCSLGVAARQNIRPGTNYFVEWLRVEARPLDGWCVTGASGSVSRDKSTVLRRFPQKEPSAGSTPTLAVRTVEGGWIGKVRGGGRQLSGIVRTSLPHGSAGGKIRWVWSGTEERKTRWTVAASFSSADEDWGFLGQSFTIRTSPRC